MRRPSGLVTVREANKDPEFKKRAPLSNRDPRPLRSVTRGLVMPWLSHDVACRGFERCAVDAHGHDAARTDAFHAGAKRNGAPSRLPASSPPSWSRVVYHDGCPWPTSSVPRCNWTSILAGSMRAGLADATLCQYPRRGSAIRPGGYHVAARVV